MKTYYRLTRQFLATFLVLASAAAWAQSDNKADTKAANGKGETATPPLVLKQQAEYQRLREQFWSKRQLAPGLPEPTGPVTARDSNIDAVGINVGNVDFYLDDGIGYHVNNLVGALVPEEKSEPVNFDKPDSFRIRIFSGEVLIRPKHLNALFNNYLLTFEPRSLSSVENTTAKGQLTVNVGARLFRVLPPVGGLPNTLTGPLSVTSDNKLVYSPESIKSLGLPLKPVLSVLGLELGTLTPFKRTGIELEGNKLVLDPERVFPPPRLEIEKISDVSLDEAGLTLKFTSGAGNADAGQPPVSADSYIWLQSGDARFYNVVLVNANLQLLSENEQPLQFHLYDYRAQTASGTIRMQKDGSLIVRVLNEFKQSIDDAPQQIRESSPRETGEEAR